nr:MAG TPA: hypothetical protein [Caudoviricetes sp.]
MPMMLLLINKITFFFLHLAPLSFITKVYCLR